MPGFVFTKFVNKAIKSPQKRLNNVKNQTGRK